MKPSKLLVPLRRLSVARGSFIAVSCIAAAAVALAAPQKLISQPKEAKAPAGSLPVGAGALPVSKSQFVHVMIELDAPPASKIYAEGYQAALQQITAQKQAIGKAPFAAAEKGKLPRVEVDAATTSRVKNQVVMLENTQKALLPALKNAGAEVVFRTQRAFNGIAVCISPNKVAELAKLPGVKAVRPMTPKYRTAFSDIDFLGTRSFWTKATANRTGFHGEGVTVADIDTGLDYVHTNFGGPGTAAAYDATKDKAPFPNQYVDTSKVPFGYDFAGDNYNANYNDAAHQPSPDSNPMDTAGHGTGTASLIAGYGVNLGGTTYRGNYDAAAPDPSSLKIAPGQAPLAKLVPLRVFGTEGSTNLVTEAIDYAMDPNGDGDMSDHVDVINMSLGSDNGSPDDDSAIAASNAAAAGIIVCSAAGNAGDTYYIASSPASGTGTLSIAASFNNQAGFIADANVTIHKPNAYAGSKKFAIYGSPSPHVPKGGLTGDVVEARPANGGDPNSDGSPNVTPLDNAQYMNGKICLVNRGSSTFYQKAIRAQNSGAKGVIIVNQNNPGADPIVAGLTPPAGDPAVNIPVVMIARTQDVDDYRAACQFDPQTGVPQNPEGSNVTIFNDNQVISHGGAAPDTMASYSSRGPTQATTALKPDLTAPAEVVGVATQHTGSGVMLFNGTSSATPHVAGGMALARQLHPDWTVQEMNALMMNTANHDLYTTTAKTTQYGLGRVGAGRVDFDLASQSDVVAFNSQDQGAVSISFGDVEVPVDGKVAISKEITIRNKGDNDITYNGSIQMVTSVGDANFTGAQSVVTVPAHSQVAFPILFQATGNTLKKTRDPSITSTQSTNFGGLTRDWLAEAGAYGVLTPQNPGPGATTLRIPLYAAPKPVSSMHAATKTFTPPSANGSFTIQLDGAPINTGGSVSGGAILSVLKALELQYTNPSAAPGSSSNDPDIIKYVGVTSDYSTYTDDKSPTTITFGIEGFGDATVPSFVSSDKEIYIDLNSDGVPDYVIYADSLRNAAVGSGTTHTNVYYSVLANLHTGSGFYEYRTNLYSPGSLDPNNFNNSSLLMSVDARDLGYTGAGQSDFSYWVETYDQNTGDLKFRTPTMHYDIAAPGFNVAQGSYEPFYNVDYPGTGQNIDVNYNGGNIQANKSQGVLLIHRHNGLGQRSEVVTLTSPKIESFTPDNGPVGTNVTIRGRNFDNHTVARFTPNVAAKTRVMSPTTLVATVPKGAKTGPITVTNGIGSDTSSKPFTVTPRQQPSPTPSPTASPTN